MTGKSFTVPQLTQKFQRMREQYLAMRSILDDPNITGISWNPVQCNIDCTPYMWDWIKKKKPEARHLKGNLGLPHFTIIGEVFWDSSTQGAFSCSSKETDEQEKEVLNRNLREP